jgi:hypothetical protein
VTDKTLHYNDGSGPAGTTTQFCARHETQEIQGVTADFRVAKAGPQAPKHAELRPGCGGESEGCGSLWASGKPVLLDPADYPLASQYRWWIREGYVVGRIEGRDVRLHRFLLEPPAQMVVDHIDGDPLNNRRSNLRVCRTEENLRNRRKTQKPTSSRFKGVWFAKAAAHTGKPWRAQCRVRGKVTYLGSFSTEEGAGLAYDLAAKREYGEFARLNFPEHHPLSRLAPGGRRV